MTTEAKRSFIADSVMPMVRHLEPKRMAFYAHHIFSASTRDIDCWWIDYYFYKIAGDE